jgi:hypothetical protein
MPVSLSSLRSAVGGIAGAAGRSQGRMVMRGGRAYKLVPAGAKLQRRHRRTGGGRPDRMQKILELAVIASILKGSH